MQTETTLSAQIGTERRIDALGVSDDSGGSLLVSNYGDVAFLKELQFPNDLLPSELIFLRLLSYLAFIDEVAVPARLILDSQPLMEAIELAAPLLREGIIRPERRANMDSFSSLAVERRLETLGRQRAERLDELSHNARLFRFDDLQKTYTEILQADLAPEGAFRSTISGGRRGRTAAALNMAHKAYMAGADGTPENFATIVGRHALGLSQRAHRWAMARYYSTPALFDDRNMREIPAPAADLLLSGRVKEQMSLPEPTIAPADLLLQSVKVALPAHRVTLDHEIYCETILRLRSELPEARKMSKAVLDATEAHAVSREVAESFAKELRKQQHSAGIESSHRAFVIGSWFVGTVVGGIGDLFVGIPGIVSAPLGLGVGAAADKLQTTRDQARRRRESPWVLAIGMFDKMVRSFRQKNA
jgi:hypothetical protein